MTKERLPDDNADGEMAPIILKSPLLVPTRTANKSGLFAFALVQGP
jgi:hypothetical protein